jgi:hypothetical protein
MMSKNELNTEKMTEFTGRNACSPMYNPGKKDSGREGGRDGIST